MRNIIFTERFVKAFNEYRPMSKPKKLKQVVLRDNKTGQFISVKRFKKLSKKRTSKEKIYA